MIDDARPSLLHGRYNLVESLLDYKHVRNSIIIYCKEYIPAYLTLMSFDRHDQRYRSIIMIDDANWPTIDVPYSRCFQLSANTTIHLHYG
jgi:hypothetical protein